MISREDYRAKALGRWPRYYTTWRFAAERICAVLQEPELTFQVVSIGEPAAKRMDPTAEIPEWWGATEVEWRRKQIESFLTHGSEWRSRAGLTRTVELLFEHRADPEKRAAVWLSAALEDLLRHGNYPVAWRGQMQHTAVTDIAASAYHALGDFGGSPFHHAMRNLLPVPIFMLDEPGYPQFETEDAFVDNVIRQCVVAAAVSLGSSRLVLLKAYAPQLQLI